jgi:hypothetical protein
MNKLQKSIILLFLCCFIFAYWSLPQTFFEQDEWQYFSSNIFALGTVHSFLNVTLPFKGQLTHFFPLGTLFFLMEQMIFGLKAAPYFIVNLSFQLILSGLLFYLIKLLTEKNILAIMTGGFFLINSRGNQALTWVAAGVGTFPSAIFLLLTIIFFIKFIDNEKNNYFLLFSILSFVISLLFKEISLFLFAFLPIILVICRKRWRFNNIRKFLLSFFLLFIFYGLIRLFFLFFSVRSSQPEMGDVSSASFFIYFFRLFSVPLRSLSQSFFPQSFLVSVSDELVHLAYPQFVASDGAANPYIAQSIAFDLVSFILTVLILMLIFIFYKYYKNREEKKLTKSILFFLFFSLTSFLPFIFIPGKGGYFSIMEPRNLYIPVMSSSFFIAILFYYSPIYLFKNKKIAKILTFSFALIFIFINVISIRENVNELKKIGSLRRSFLETIKNNYPKLSKNAVFYIKSDSSYYGLPAEETNLPVQTGFGRMLMVWYQGEEKFPNCLYENQFLHGLISQEYKACQGRGFGYFRNYDKLTVALRVNGIPAMDVIAYSWQGKIEKFSNITSEIQTELKRDLDYESAK